MTRRIGMLTPSSNTVLEPVTSRLSGLVEGRVTVHYSRFPVTVIDDTHKAHHQFDIDSMLSAARLLADARVAAIAWNGTSGAWEGVEHDRRLVQAIQDELRVPATTATLALLELMSANNLHTYGLVVPYVDPIIERIEANLAAEGLRCAATSSARLTDNFAFSEVDPSAIAARIRQVAAERPDAVVVHCTNLRGADVADELAYELGIPVLDSVVVTFWGVLRLIGENAELPGLQGLARGAAHA
ncbi:MAG: maleate cis-trans isomerase family protein [Candidatus Acidiferrales bacterium]